MKIFCFFLFSFLFTNSTQASENPLVKEISLADWGLSEISQIGYVSVGVLHKEQGDELIIYDVRKQKPVIKEPRAPFSRVPSFKGDMFLVSNFDQGNVNRLGGYFSGFAKPPSQYYSLAIEKSPDNTSALSFNYTNRPPGFVGFWIHLFDFKEPPLKRIFLDATPFNYLTFSIRSQEGESRLGLQIADSIWEKKGDSLRVGSVDSFLDSGKLGSKWQQLWVPLEKLPKQINKKALASIVFVAEGGGSGHIFIKDLAFTTKRDIHIPTDISTPMKNRQLKMAMWLWETEKVLNNPKEQDTLIQFCKSQGITDLFVQIPYMAKNIYSKNDGTTENNAELDSGWEIIWDTTPMRPLISKLNAEHIRVHALDGDPRFALKKWHGRLLALIRKIIEYNKEVPINERFVGIRYDNEPYLLPTFGGVLKEEILKQYLTLLGKSKVLTQKGGIELSADIPFWFDGLNEYFEPTTSLKGRPMTEHMIDLLDGVGIMDYRTQAYGADGVIAHATDELEYASKNGKKIYVGLETYPLPDETIIEFASTGKGKKLVIKKMGGSKTQLTLVPEQGKTPTKDAIVLKQTRTIQVPSSKLTFSSKTIKDLQEVKQQSELEFLQYPSFDGFIIHSYESYRPWIEKQK